MFCFQCQEAAKGTGCVTKGVCGKEPQTSTLMDMLLYVTHGIAAINVELRNNGLNNAETDHQIVDNLFCTITNANFDDTAISKRIGDAFLTKTKLVELAKKNHIELPRLKQITIECSPENYISQGEKIGVLNERNEDIRSLKQLIIYGIKGAAAYVEHAYNLGFEDDAIYADLENALAQVAQPDISVDTLINLTLGVGECGVKGMALLDKANTTTYGNPEITAVNIGVGVNPGILVSGHDLKDLEELLKQTEGSGVDVYTHSEMLPAHYYPAFKSYKHFIGNYGNSWWKQNEEFETFNGVILFTTNCIVPPSSKNTYADRIYTTGAAGLNPNRHIPNRKVGKAKDFSRLIEHAKQCEPPKAIESGSIVGGFAHNQVLALADKVITAIKEGAIKKFVVMAGCDGRMKSREYYTNFAQSLPKDNVILTAGCAKYRYNKLALGDINGIPRVLDAGQCNDSYSLVIIALALKDAFGLNDINHLPIIYNIAWYEQKAVIVLLALLSLGVKNINLGPTLPAFLSPNVKNVLIDKFGIGTISNVEDDIKAWNA